MRTTAAALVLLALCACGGREAEPEPQGEPGAALAVILGTPDIGEAGATFPIVLRNEGTGAIAQAAVDCSFTDAEGGLLYTGKIRSGRLDPGAEHGGAITVPQELAGRIGGLNCSPVAR